MRYAYRAGEHADNARLHQAMLEGVPLIYLFGIDPGIYLPHWPVYVVDVDPPAREFVVSELPLATAGAASEERRRYAVRRVRTRLHQAGFRARVLRAYAERCAMCRLGHAELLDAAHIIGDAEEAGVTTTANGLALCKLHHAAFDRHIVGVRPDLVLQVRREILAEIDGPMLRHGLQELQGARLLVLPRRPSDRPDRAPLERRYERFRSAG
ncbi:MAG: HNH endonuclease [Actinomycetota bacterium]|nr:HNH endonuclease [Actinomycetota bacterium]